MTDRIEFDTVAAALEFVTKAKRGTRFGVFVKADINAPEGGYFPAMTGLMVEKGQFKGIISDVGRTFVDKRGGKLVLSYTPAEEGKSYSRPSIWLH